MKHLILGKKAREFCITCKRRTWWHFYYNEHGNRIGINIECSLCHTEGRRLYAKQGGLQKLEKSILC